MNTLPPSSTEPTPDPAPDLSRQRLAWELAGAFAARLDVDELIPLVLTRCREVFDADNVALVVPDAKSSPPPVAEAAPGLAGRLLSAPLVSSRGRLGVIRLTRRPDDCPFRDEDAALLEALARPIAAAVENARLHGQIKASEARLRARLEAIERDVAAWEAAVDGALGSPRAGRAPRCLRSARAAFEARFIAETLRENGGNVTRSARALGLSRVMLQKKMKAYGLRRLLPDTQQGERCEPAKQTRDPSDSWEPNRIRSRPAPPALSAGVP